MQPAAPIRYGPLWTRAFHAFNLVVVLLMAASGLQIYNANPVFGGRDGATVPALFTLGGWLAGGRDWPISVSGSLCCSAGGIGAWRPLAISAPFASAATPRSDAWPLTGSCTP
jgi:hypothetical protein